MKLRKFTAAFISAVFLTTGVFGAPAYASKAEDAPAATKGEVILLKGKLDGNAPAEGTLEVLAWPSNETLSRLQESETVMVEPVSTALVDSKGQFEFRISDLDVLKPFASEYGEVNLTLSGLNGKDFYRWSFEVLLDEVEPGNRDALRAVDRIVPVGVEEPQSGGPAEAYIEKSCVTSVYQNVGDRAVPVAGVFSTNSGTLIDYIYVSGQSSSLGVGSSTGSATTGFKASGTTSVSSSAQLNFPAQTGAVSKLMKTSFYYKKFRTMCAYPYSTAIVYEVRPVSFSGGTSTATVSSPTANYCMNYQKGSGLVKDKHTQVRWTGAVSLFGASLSAQTGWSGKGKLDVAFKTKDGKLCGVGAQATNATAYQIVAK